jgi:hypothetical protein
MSHVKKRMLKIELHLFMIVYNFFNLSLDGWMFFFLLQIICLNFILFYIFHFGLTSIKYQVLVELKKKSTSIANSFLSDHSNDQEH